MIELTCFKTYDIRGRLGIDLDENIAFHIGAAFAVAPNSLLKAPPWKPDVENDSLSVRFGRGEEDAGIGRDEGVAVQLR
jgi:phosphomannomutase